MKSSTRWVLIRILGMVFIPVIILAVLWWARPWPPLPGAAEDHIVIDCVRNRLYHYGTHGVTRYDVATGRPPGGTPDGVFTIVVREELVPGETNPQLGTRWLGLQVPGDDEKAARGLKYGIHGTDDPGSIGGHASGGCVRMHTDDVVQLYERVEVGTTVFIRPVPWPLRWYWARRGTEPSGP